MICFLGISLQWHSAPSEPAQSDQQASLDIRQLLIIQILKKLWTFGTGLYDYALEALPAFLHQGKPFDRMDAQVDYINLLRHIID